MSTISAATDVAIGFGDPIEQVVDLNFQSGPDATVATRLHLYNAAFHHRFQVPVRSILVLLRPKAATPGLTGKLTYIVDGKRVSFEYDVMRLWHEPVARFLEGGLALLPIAPLCKMPAKKVVEESIRRVVHEIDRRLISEPDQAQAVRLMTAAFILTGMRVPKDRLASIYEGVRVMHKTTAWDSAVDEGILKGVLWSLLKVGRQRFGDPSLKVETALKAIQELDRLERMAEVILNVDSWKSLLSVQ